MHLLSRSSWWAGAVLALASGCALERTSMSMDSISRRPFFGFQLAPKPKPPVYDRGVVQNPRRKDDLPKIQPAIREVESERHWPDWLSLPSARPVVPLPRTDLPAVPSSPQRVALSPESTAIEF